MRLEVTMQLTVAGSTFWRIKNRVFLKSPGKDLIPKYISSDIPSKPNYLLHEGME